jgi:integrase
VASIEKRERGGGTSWRVKWREDGQPRSETFHRKTDAVEFRGLVDAAGQRYPEGWIPGQGNQASTSGLTVREWAQRAVAARTGITAGTRDKYAAMLERHVYPVMGSWPLDAVNRERAALWLNTLAATPTEPRAGKGATGRTLSAKSVRNVHGLVSSIWSDAIDNDLVTGNPFARLKLPDDAPDRDEMTFLTREEFAVLYGLTPEPYQLLVRTLVESGLRWGEATALQVRHLVGDTLIVNQAWKADTQGRLTIGPPKTRAGRRSVHIPDDLADALAVSAAGKRADEWLFTTPTGYPLRNGTFHTRVWAPLMDKVEPLIGKRPRIHDLRHSHASWLLASGEPMFEVMGRMGHTSIATTQGVYGHLMERDTTGVKAAASSGVGGAAKVAPIRRKRASRAT